MGLTIAKSANNKRKWFNKNGEDIGSRYYNNPQTEIDYHEHIALFTMYHIIKNIEENNLAHYFLPEKVHTYLDEKKKTFHRTAEYIDEEVKRDWIELDIDKTIEGSKLNHCGIGLRLNFAKERLPVLRDVELVAQLSNKAYLPDIYPDRLCLRVFAKLEEPMTNAQLREIFKPYDDKLEWGLVDTNIYKRGNPLLIVPPGIEGETYKETRKRPRSEETVIYVPAT